MLAGAVGCGQKTRYISDVIFITIQDYIALIEHLKEAKLTV